MRPTYTILRASDKNCDGGWGRRRVCPRPCCCSADRNMMIVIPVIYGMARKRQTRNDRVSKHQRLGLLDLGQALHLDQHVRRDRAVDLDQRDGVAALLDAAEMEGGDIELGI